MSKFSKLLKRIAEEALTETLDELLSETETQKPKAKKKKAKPASNSSSKKDV